MMASRFAHQRWPAHRAARTCSTIYSLSNGGDVRVGVSRVLVAVIVYTWTATHGTKRGCS